MADDKIDIEEHDILDNPLVRRMFPDISILKKEVLDFDDEVLIKEIPANDVVQKKAEKCPVIVIDDNGVLPRFSSKPADHAIDAKITESICTQIGEAENDPIIVVDEANLTLPYLSSGPADQVIDTDYIESSFIEIDEAEKFPTIVIEETNETLPYVLSTSADQVIDVNFTQSNFTQINIAKKYPTIEIDETNVTLPCYLSIPSDKVMHEKSTKSNLTHINEVKEYPTKLSDKTTSIPSESLDKIFDEKSTKNNFTQINEAKKYPSKVIDETNTNLPSFPVETADQDLGAKFLQTNTRYENCDGRFVKSMKTKKYINTLKICPNIVKVKPIARKRISDSVLLNSKNVTCNINDEKANESYVKLNHLKLPKTSHKTSVLPKQIIIDSLTLDRNLPQHSKQGGNIIPLINISSAKSNSDCVNNSQFKQCRWEGNKIILGSKSSALESQKQKISTSVRVLVENLGTFLSKSTRYCKICFILFPSNKTLADHRDLIHSQLNNNPSAKSKKIIRNIKKGVNLNNKHKCNVCGSVCSTLSNLLRHKRCVHSLLPIKKKKKKPNFKQNIQPQPDGKLSKETNFRCTHCNKSFSCQQILIDHMYNVLQNKRNTDAIKSSEIVNLDGVKMHTNSRDFYRCPLCSYYFKRKIYYVKHLKNKHKIVDKINLEKVVFDPVCKYCSNEYHNFEYFNAHVYKRHQKQLKFSRHLPKNTVEKARKIPKYEEKPQSKVNNYKYYTSKDNVNVVVAIKDEKTHKKYLLKSVFFKCVTCNICFLSGEEAANHIGHERKVENWKCSKCSYTFKKEEQSRHAHQHLFCDSFEVFEIGENTYLYVLFKCPNCASYFCEKDFFYHYSICETRSPDSAYCKTCHILIDNNIKELHDVHHKMERGKELNNILIETDVIAYNDVFNNRVKESFGLPKRESEVKQSNYICHERTGDKIRKTLNITYKGLTENNLIKSVIDSDVYKRNEEKPKKEEFLGEKMTKTITGISLRFMYCDTCTAFIFVNTVRKLYNHIKGRCLNLSNYVCKYCGLVLSNKTINSHRKLHQDVPDLSISDFTFYDLRNGKEICPPVPKYPYCHLCETHFITKTAIISHVCNEDYLKCRSCNIKLTKSAFSLHMSFHNYSSKTRSEMSLVDLSVHSIDSHSTSVTKLPYLSESNKNRENIYLMVYICKICKVAVDTYDRVIEHCHYHISSQEKEILTKPCDSCNIIFEDTCFENHKILHSCNQNKKFSSLTYDAFYVTAEDKVWLNHLFGSLSKNEIDSILKNSIYNFERKIKMHILQDGFSDLTFYKCAKCNSLIDKSSLYDHCMMDFLCYKAKIVPCPVCGILMSEEFLVKHEKNHETQNLTRSYRLVLFNCDDDKKINHLLNMPRNYILYECRNCNGIVDKKQFQYHKCDFDDLSKCSHCGLLLYNNDYMPHVVKHKEFCSFHESNIIVILLGAVNDVENLSCRYKPSFRGIKLDYLFYKCNKCQVCFKDKHSGLTHECAKDLAKTKCVPCDLYIKDSFFKKHRKLHECDPYFSKGNITVLELHLRYSGPSDVDVIVIEDEEDLNGIKDNTAGDNKLNSTNNTINNDCSDETMAEKCDEILRCHCGLHFITEASALSHLTKCNNSRSSKQTCPKCGLLFKPNILYTHLLKHHGSKQVSYKFNITPISKRK